MKRKKITTFVLLFLCILIWGTIGWKVYSALRESPPVASQPSKRNSEERKDTVALLLNYRDPFLGDYHQAKATEEKEPVQPDIVNEMYVEPLGEIQPDFQYKGVIRLGKNAQAMIHWNGKSLLLGLRGKVGEFSILRIEDDKLTVGRKNKKYELPIQ